MAPIFFSFFSRLANYSSNPEALLVNRGSKRRYVVSSGFTKQVIRRGGGRSA